MKPIKPEVFNGIYQALNDHIGQPTPKSLVNALAERGLKVVKMQPKEMATHCPNGHEYTEDNIYWYNGLRKCKKCKANAVAKTRS